MKPVLSLFLCVFLFLCIGGTAHARTPGGQPFLSQPVKKTPMARQAAGTNDRLAQDDTSNDTDRFLASDEDRDEDETIDKNPLVLSKTLFAFVRAFLADYSHCRSAEPLSFCDHLSLLSSHKYIVHRTLRL